MELKTTLLMPKTDFEMRANLCAKEPALVKKWQDIGLYEKMNQNREGCEEFILHDGPPYANGNMHCGHMLNRLLKDFTIRYKNMSNYKTPFIFGWDTHGLPIENMVTKSGVNRKTTPIVEFRKICEEYAKKQVGIQKEQIRRLGVLGDYDHPYMTILPEYEARQIEAFSKMACQGLIFKGLKPVYWSPSSESALAEAEIEYEDVNSFAIYVAFKVKDGKGILPNDASVLIWTTTPWTIPSNLAISVHPRFTYGLFETSKGLLVFLKDFEETLTKELDLKDVKLIKTFSGQELEYVVCKHPFYDRDSLLIVGEHVTNDAGTGCVHTAPGHGADDFVVCQKYGIKPYCPVDGKGYMDDSVGEDLKGLFYEDANQVVLDKLTSIGALLKATQIRHSYPHDWRTHKPLIFRATPQWFCSIEPIKEKLLKEIHNVSWTPSWGEQRMVNMIKDRHDWCISRQRAWGVPLPIIYGEDGTPLIDEAVFAHIAKLFKEHGSNIWFTKEAKDLLPEGYKTNHSPNGLFTKETDIMDVWFDSGSSFFGVLKERGLSFPADLYLEGNDQYRGWFNSSLIISVACFGVAPFKECVTHGWVMDENWEKMSKSKGNGIDPTKVANQFGADLLRLWASTVDYQQDSRISEAIINQIAEIYRKIRNTFKFLLGNLSNGQNGKFDEKDLTSDFEAVDTFILAELERVKNASLLAYKEYNFAKVISEIATFMSSDLSSFYLDITKDILYCESQDSLRRKQVQSVIYKVSDTMMRLLTPILPFTMEEVNLNLPNAKKENPQLLDMPKKSNLYSSQVLQNYKDFMKLREDTYKVLDEIRKSGEIGSFQEAQVDIVTSNKTLFNLLSNLSQSELARLLIVSKVNISSGKDSVKGYHTLGSKCPRCWNYVDKLVKIEDVEVCPRCKSVLEKK